MFQHQFTKRVRYAETDKMGYLYYGHYAKYYEIGRVEAMRSLGCSYQKMEDELGIMLPVLSLEARYLQPAYYDEEITINTYFKQLPTKMMTFYHELSNESGKIINTATVKLFCIDIKSGERVSTPNFLIEKLIPYFE